MARKPAKKDVRKPVPFDASVYLKPGVGGTKTDAGGRPVTDKGGRIVRKDA